MFRRKPTGPAVHCVLRGARADGSPMALDLVKARYDIGRAAEVDGKPIDFVVPGDPTISRLQCTLEAEGRTYRLRNRSGQGTQVNDAICEDSHLLATGDEIWIGEGTRVRFEVLTDEERSEAHGEEYQREKERAKSGPTDAADKKRKTTMAIVLVALVWGATLAVFLATRKGEAPGYSGPSAGTGPILKGYVDALGPPALVPLPLDERTWTTRTARWDEDHGPPSALVFNEGTDGFRILDECLAYLRGRGHQSFEAARAAAGSDALGAQVVARVEAVEDVLERALQQRRADVMAAYRNRDIEKVREILEETIRYDLPGTAPIPFRQWALAVLGSLPPKPRR